MLKIIAAVSTNRVIGRNQQIPWRLRDDMNWFKNKTGSIPVVMGRNTFLSFPEKFRPLPGRENIILTRDRSNAISDHENVTFVHDFEQVIERARREDVFVIGGTEPYRLALPHADELYLTRVRTEVEGGIFFPQWDENEWKLVWAQDNESDERNEFDFSWEVYRRKYPPRRTEHPFVEVRNCRTDQQKKVYQEIIETGHCPFCPENLPRWHKPRILLDGKYWIVSYNQWPYTDTECHLLLILKEHAVDLSGLPQGAGEEYFDILKWVEKEFGIAGGATWMRFGEPIVTGATVRHLHAQLIAPHPKAKEPTKIYVGSSTSSQG